MKSMTRNATHLFTACALVLLACAGAQAQQVYRIVGPDGRVTYSDKPPADPGKPATASTGNAASPDSSGALPFTLRAVVSRFPVTIYTGNSCAPCVSGRTFLVSRGIPFSERTITTEEDAAALQRLSGTNSLPVLTIGGQKLQGYSDLEWAQYLDAAGYPATSQLPANYRRPTATPLVNAQRPAAGGAAAATADPSAPPEVSASPAPAAPPPATADNPNGIRF